MMRLFFVAAVIAALAFVTEKQAVALSFPSISIDLVMERSDVIARVRIVEGREVRKLDDFSFSYVVEVEKSFYGTPLNQLVGVKDRLEIGASYLMFFSNGSRTSRSYSPLLLRITPLGMEFQGDADWLTLDSSRIEMPKGVRKFSLGKQCTQRAPVTNALLSACPGGYEFFSWKDLDVYLDASFKNSGLKEVISP